MLQDGAATDAGVGETAQHCCTVEWQQAGPVWTLRARWPAQLPWSNEVSPYNVCRCAWHVLEIVTRMYQLHQVNCGACSFCLERFERKCWAKPSALMCVHVCVFVYMQCLQKWCNCQDHFTGHTFASSATRVLSRTVCLVSLICRSKHVLACGVWLLQVLLPGLRTKGVDQVHPRIFRVDCSGCDRCVDGEISARHAHAFDTALCAVWDSRKWRYVYAFEAALYLIFLKKLSVLKEWFGFWRNWSIIVS